MPLHLKQTFPLMIWILNNGEGDGIESIFHRSFISEQYFKFDYIVHSNKEDSPDWWLAKNEKNIKIDSFSVDYVFASK